ncbi:hypothetical protein ABPG72_017072 [Tetrahymena utriculariae]
MGQSRSQNRKQLDESKIVYMCTLIKMKLNDYNCSRQAIIQQKEKDLLLGLQNSQQNARNQQQEIHQISSIIENILNVRAAESIIRKCDIVKDHAQVISQSQGRLQLIKDLSPFIENICWSNMIFGMDCINQFKDEMLGFYGEDLENNIYFSANIDDRVRRALAPAIIASYDDLCGYVNMFCSKYNITITQFNENIHNFVYVQNIINSTFGNQNSCNVNIYSQCNPSQSIQHYLNGFQPTNNYENTLIAQNKMQSGLIRSSQKQNKKSNLLFCY